MPRAGQATGARTGRAAEQRVEFEVPAVIYKHHIVLHNKLLHGAFIQKRRQGTGPRLPSLRHPDHSPALLQVLNSKPGMGEGGKGRISIKGTDSKTLSSSPILNCNVFPRFSCSLILECDFKEE